MVGASNAFNHYRKDLDALMDRPKSSCSTGRMSQVAAFIVQVFDSCWNCLLYNQSKTAMFGAISIFLYTVFTFKTMTSLSVFVGAFQEQSFYVGLGCATGEFGIEAGTLFLIQFFAISTFWAIGWFCMDYEKLVSLCCLQAKDKGTALQIILYTVWLILASHLFWVIQGVYIRLVRR
jgi:protoheme IX farnesyltransferase